MSYKVVRRFSNNGRKYTVHRGLTEQEAQEICRNPESSWKTATSKTAKQRTKKYGPWFDGYDVE